MSDPTPMQRPASRAARLSAIEQALLTHIITSQAQLSSVLASEGIEVTQVAPLARTIAVVAEGAEPQPDYACRTALWHMPSDMRMRTTVLWTARSNSRCRVRLAGW